MAKDKASKEATPPPEATPSFEERLDQLETIVKQLESPNLQLDEAIALYEKGVGLSLDCRGYLTAAETRIEMLMKKGGEEEEADVVDFDPFGERER